MKLESVYYFFDQFSNISKDNGDYMWCKNCNIETNEEKCPICGTETVEDIPTEVLWCEHCKTPVIQEVNQVDKGICPICGNKMKYMATDDYSQGTAPPIA